MEQNERFMSTLVPGGGVKSTKELNDTIRLWSQEGKSTLKKVKDLQSWVEDQDDVKPDGETYGLLLDCTLSVSHAGADPIVSRLMKCLLEHAAFDTSQNVYPPEKIQFYMDRILNRWIYGARQTKLAQDWLARWWYYHEESPSRIPVPTPAAYAEIMLAWGKEGEPSRALALLRDMKMREQIEAQVYHYETTLNAFVHAVVRSQKKNRRSSVGHDAENVLLQMMEWLDEFRSGVMASASIDATSRSPQTRVLQNLNKVVQVWVDSRRNEAAIRSTAILDIIENVFLDSEGSDTDWAAFAEAYSHVIRAWSFAAAVKQDIRRELLRVSEDYRDPTQHVESFLVRLEEFVDRADAKDAIPLKTWRRIYGSAIAAYGTDLEVRSWRENSKNARRLWDRFKERGYGDPGVALYDHLFHVYGKMGAKESSDLLWQEMLDDGMVVADVKPYNWRLLAGRKSSSGSFDARSLADARHIWNEMCEAGVSPDSITYNIYLSCFVGTRDIAVAREGDMLFHQLLEISLRNGSGCQVTVVSLNTIIRMWSTLAIKSRLVSEKEEALKSVLLILIEVHKLFSEGILTVRPNAKTRAGITSLLNDMNVEEGKRLGVLRLLEKFSSK